MLLWCRRCIINKPELLKEKGPLLLACNHPNSFLDGILLDTIFAQPVHALARGDAFRNKFFRRVLVALKMLPVYRTSEGVENLSENYKTFDACKAIFKKDGIVQVFSEGKCINEWHLRPLKKGTARLAVSSWAENIPLRVLPVGINYSSFKRFGKNIYINFGSIIQSGEIEGKTDGNQHQSFNALLEKQFRDLVFEINPADRTSQEKKLAQKSSILKKILLFIPALTGWLLHAPLYLPLKSLTNKTTKETDHYDSVLTSLLMLIYPLYLLLITGIVFAITGNSLAFLLLIGLPFSGWSYMQVKPQLDK
jgi:1-acyl-sn-glycerol-3-phosphate acyltransferase